MPEIKQPKRMFQLVNGKAKAVHVFENTQDAQRFEAGARGVEGWIIFEGRIVKVRSAFSRMTKPRWVGPWTHVFAKPFEREDGIEIMCTQSFKAPTARRLLLARALVKDARASLRAAQRSSRVDVRNATTALSAALREAKRPGK